MSKRKIRKFAEEQRRVETGAVQFGEDWPGLFVRGDDAFGLMIFLIQMAEEGRIPPFGIPYNLIDIINNHVHARPSPSPADHEWARQVLEEMGE